MPVEAPVANRVCLSSSGLFDNLFGFALAVGAVSETGAPFLTVGLLPLRAG